MVADGGIVAEQHRARSIDQTRRFGSAGSGRLGGGPGQGGYLDPEGIVLGGVVETMVLDSDVDALRW